MFNRLSEARIRRVVLAGLVALLLVGTVTGIQNRPLPTFQVKTVDGSPTDSSTWQMQGKWLVIYLEGHPGPSSHLLSGLTKDRYPQLASRTIIIVGGGEADHVKAMQKRFADLSEATWYADPMRNAAKAMSLQGAPVTLGVENKTMRWAISGIPYPPTLLSSVLKKWTAQP